MTITILTPELFRSEGGISRIMRLYVKALTEPGIDVRKIQFVNFLDGNESTGKVQELAGQRFAGASNCARSRLRFSLAAVRRGLSSDRMLCGHLHQLVLAWIASVMRPSLKYYLVAHGIEVWRPYSLFERMALRGAERIICVSNYTRRQMLRFYPELDANRLTVLPNTFDPTFCNGNTESAVIDPDRGPIILMVSRMAPADSYKGIDTMIEAMPRILKLFPAARLRIVGGGDDRARLEVLARRLELRSTVTFAGIVDDAQLRAEYLSCDLFALPSRKEGFGLAFLEAMNYGKPCLGASVGGAPEVVNDQVGVLVQYGNIDQITLGIADLVRHPRDRAAMLGRAREFGFALFSSQLHRILTAV